MFFEFSALSLGGGKFTTPSPWNRVRFLSITPISFEFVHILGVLGHFLFHFPTPLSYSHPFLTFEMIEVAYPRTSQKQKMFLTSGFGELELNFEYANQ